MNVLFFIGAKISANSCAEIKKLKPNSKSGVYEIQVPQTGSVKVFCDMSTDSGGWTLVWSYSFTDYTRFGNGYNAVTPIPNWPSSNTNVPRSTTPPLQEYSSGALDFNIWKSVGSEFLIKSNVNHWISCKPDTGSLVTWMTGSVQCRNVKNIAPIASCQGTVPDKIITSNSRGLLLIIRGQSYFYFFDGDTNSNWPVHDPCGTMRGNQKTGVISPGGNIFVR